MLLLERQQGYTEVQMRLAGDLRWASPALCAAEHMAPLLLTSIAEAMVHLCVTQALLSWAC